MTAMAAMKVFFLVIGLGSAYWLMRGTEGNLAIDKATGGRIAHGLALCVLGGWFTQAKSDGQFFAVDWIALTLLAALALAAFLRPSIRV